jgi:hypothetical protein
MNIKYFAVLILLVHFKAMALVELPKGECQLEGLILQSQTKDWYFILNHGSNSETRLRITEGDTKKLEPQGQFVDARLKFKQTVFSFYGEASLVKVTKGINPFHDPKVYHTNSDVRKACEKSSAD